MVFRLDFWTSALSRPVEENQWTLRHPLDSVGTILQLLRSHYLTKFSTRKCHSRFRCVLERKALHYLPNHAFPCLFQPPEPTKERCQKSEHNYTYDDKKHLVSTARAVQTCIAQPCLHTGPMSKKEYIWKFQPIFDFGFLKKWSKAKLSIKSYKQSDKRPKNCRTGSYNATLRTRLLLFDVELELDMDGNCTRLYRNV